MAEATMAADLLPLATEIVAAHLSNNKVPSGELPDLIRSVVQTLAAVHAGEPKPVPRPDAAVPIKKSVSPEYIVCLEDGKRLKMLKRHLMTHYNLTPDQYRQKWGLSADYPMVAPNYAEQRRKLAKSIGLGTKRRRTRK